MNIKDHKLLLDIGEIHEFLKAKDNHEEMDPKVLLFLQSLISSKLYYNDDSNKDEEFTNFSNNNENSDAHHAELQKQILLAERERRNLEKATNDSEFECQMLREKVEELEAVNRQVVEAEMDRLQSTVEEVEKDLSDLKICNDRQSMNYSEAKAKLNSLEQKRNDRKAELSAQQTELVKIQIMEEREIKHTSMAAKGVAGVTHESKELEAKISKMDDRVSSIHSEMKLKDEEITLLTEESCKVKEKFESLQKQSQNITDQINSEIADNHNIVTKKLELEVATKSMKEKIRQTQNTLLLEQKKLEVMKRTYQRKYGIVASVQKTTLPSIAANVVEGEKELQASTKTLSLLENQINDAHDLIQVDIVKLMKRENFEKSKVELYNQSTDEIDTYEETLLQKRLVERKQEKLLSILSSEKDMKNRELTNSKEDAKELEKDNKLIDLLILDARNKLSELTVQVKEYAALMQIASNEKSNYSTLIKVSKDNICQMKDKISKMEDKMKSLEIECTQKKSIVEKEINAHESSRGSRATLKIELIHTRNLLGKKQIGFKDEKVEINRLHSGINMLKKVIKRQSIRKVNVMKKKRSVLDQLEIGDETLIQLSEKLKCYEALLSRGNEALRLKEGELRILTLKSEEYLRKINVLRTHISNSRDYGVENQRLRQRLKEETSRVNEMCQSVAVPSRRENCSYIKGNDFDYNDTKNRVRRIEERLDLMKKRVLEKDVLIEDVTAEIQQLKHEAKSSRKKSEAVGNVVNKYERQLQLVTRKMMALVSELSMYQASRTRLQEEIQLQEEEIADAKMLIENGQPPSESAVRKMSRRAHLTDKTVSTVSDNQGEGWRIVDSDNSTCFRTKAQSRSSAYIPDKSLGISKPYYGGLLPFKPTVVMS